ncbi:MAG: universal stress protein [Bacteroidota bacterium]
MQKLFNRILVPIDFSPRSKTAAEKAVDIATIYDCSIHLLHVAEISPWAAASVTDVHSAIPYNFVDNTKELEYRLSRLAGEIKSLANDKIKVTFSVLTGSWEQTIIDLATREKFDLILIGQKGRFIGKRKMILNPDTIAERANIAVITIPSNRRIVRLYSVVIPITDFLPVRKLMYGIYVASNYNTTIKLLAVENEKTKTQAQLYLKKAYQLIHDHSNVTVEQDTIYSENIAEAINDYAMQQSADLVIVNPGSQTKMPGFLSRLLGKILQKYSAPPVLTINTA